MEKMLVNVNLAKLEGISGKTELTKNDGFMWVKDASNCKPWVATQVVIMLSIIVLT